jgi:hypothetical protein
MADEDDEDGAAPALTQAADGFFQVTAIFSAGEH